MSLYFDFCTLLTPNIHLKAWSLGRNFLFSSFFALSSRSLHRHILVLLSSPINKGILCKIDLFTAITNRFDWRKLLSFNKLLLLDWILLLRLLQFFPNSFSWSPWVQSKVVVARINNHVGLSAREYLIEFLLETEGQVVSPWRRRFTSHLFLRVFRNICLFVVLWWKVLGFVQIVCLSARVCRSCPCLDLVKSWRNLLNLV